MGSVADWVMVGVTIITAIYLILTFRSQRIVQKAQQHITLIENERYRIEHIPIFDLSIATEPHGNKINGHRILYSKLKIILLKNNARNLYISFHCVDAKINSPYEKRIQLEIIASGNYIHDLELSISTTLERLNQGNLTLDITLTFEDLIGNEYEQCYDYSLGFVNCNLQKDPMPTYLRTVPKR
ncbi:hypothetical protein N180_02900 [Pedobacter antarcticus 4BY]|uniref:Uncharacterized protein n=2 Tax=Pedobacter antarcticus TaxID=34086 RepID=A0A081PKJ0_9SPHI|nr:hypothetical protein N180_02900 [Pedobacter antarcticus 4BY]